MTRFLLAAAVAAAGFGAASAGGPPPVYVVVDEVTVGRSAGGPDRVVLRGSFVRLKDGRGYEYGQPVAGVVCLRLDEGKAAACRAEWAEWAKAAGTGKVVAVGMCGEAGAMLAVKIHKPGEPTPAPDAVYTPGHLGRIDPPGGGGWTGEPAVQTLLGFVRERQKTDARAARR